MLLLLLADSATNITQSPSARAPPRSRTRGPSSPRTASACSAPHPARRGQPPPGQTQRRRTPLSLGCASAARLRRRRGAHPVAPALHPLQQVRLRVPDHQRPVPPAHHQDVVPAVPARHRRLQREPELPAHVLQRLELPGLRRHHVHVLPPAVPGRDHLRPHPGRLQAPPDVLLELPHRVIAHPERQLVLPELVRGPAGPGRQGGQGGGGQVIPQGGPASEHPRGPRRFRGGGKPAAAPRA